MAAVPRNGLHGPRGRSAALALAGLAAVLLACGGEPVPRHKDRTAVEWIGGLFSLDEAARETAEAALVEFAETHPETVLAALEGALTSPPITPVGAPLELKMDTDTAKWIGLSPLEHAEAEALDLPVLRCRTGRAGIVTPYFKGTGDGLIRVTVPVVPRARLLAIQRMLATRGDLDLRPVYVPPDASLVDAEAKRWLEARAAGTPYVPSEPRHRAVPTKAAPATAADFVLVTEPDDPDEVLDERIVSEGQARVGGGKPPVVILQVREVRRDAVARFTQKWAGKNLAVVLGGVVRATLPIRPHRGNVVELPLWTSADEASNQEAADLSVVLGCGARMPRPLVTLPIPPGFGEDPPPDNPVAKVFVSIGTRSLPRLDALARRDVPAWSKASAAWAAERIRERSSPGK